MDDERLAQRARLMRPSALREMLSAGTPPRLSLAGGLPPVEAFPFDTIGEITAELMAHRDARALQYTSAEGDPALRAQIAELLSAGRHRSVSPSSVVVTTGSQQGIDMIGRVLLDPGDVAVVESPTYVGALRSLAPTGARMVPVRCDDDGMDTAALARLLHDGLRPKLVYLVANFSNPSGATLVLERRLHLAALADRYGFVVVEDDQYGRLRYAGTHIDPIVTHTDEVVYLSGFSKVVAPGLRVGYLTAPDWLLRALVLAKQAADLAASSFAQRIVSLLLDRPQWWDEHLDSLRAIYRDRCDALVGAAHELLDGRLRVRAPEGGMFVWSSIEAPGVTAAALVAACRRRGLALVAGNEFSVEGGFDRELRLSYSTLTPDELREAVGVMALAFGDLG